MVCEGRAATECRALKGFVTIRIPGRPPSLNSLYVQRYQGGKALNAQHVAFRKLVAMIARPKLNPLPAGVFEAVVTVASPDFITKKRTVRAMDLDNMLKSLFDALQDAGLKDERIWRIRAEKLFSDIAYTEVSLIALGDVIALEKSTP